MGDEVAIPLRGGDAPHHVHFQEPPQRCGLCPQWCYSYKFVAAVAVFNTIALIISAGLLIGLSVTLAGPHLRALTFVAGNCTVVNATLTGDNPTCACGQRYCASTYPCLAVTVKYATRDGRVIESMIHEEEHVFTYRPHCSYQPRHCGPGHNRFSISGFQNKYGTPGRSYPCFHNPTGPGALRLRNRGVSYIFHIMFWPALLTFVFSILWCIIYCYCCGRNPETGE